MLKQLTKTGNSRTLVINKEMQAHLGLTGHCIVVEYHPGCVILRAPAQRQDFETALEETIQQYDPALKALDD